MAVAQLLCEPEILVARDLAEIPAVPGKVILQQML
jgi:hypothetical protein